MYATGLPLLSLSFFSAASTAIAIPMGIQVFAWIATLWDGKPVLRVPMLFILGFLFIFTIGGLTGVMVAAVPYDWQVHDTYFVVAHFHYVLIGGMVFPIFAALYYWTPLVTGRMLSERLGRWAFWLMFIGFNAAFLPMHVTGLLGMPRRIYTYPDDLGWNALNLVTSVFSFVFAAGVLVVRRWTSFGISGRAESRRQPVGCAVAGMAGGASAATVSAASCRSPRAIRFGSSKGCKDERWPGAATCPTLRRGEREALITSPISAEPEQILRVARAGLDRFRGVVCDCGCLRGNDRRVPDVGVAVGAVAAAVYSLLAVVDGPGASARTGRCGPRHRAAALHERQRERRLVGDGGAPHLGRGGDRLIRLRLSLPLDRTASRLAARRIADARLSATRPDFGRRRRRLSRVRGRRSGQPAGPPAHHWPLFSRLGDTRSRSRGWRVVLA